MQVIAYEDCFDWDAEEKKKKKSSLKTQKGEAR